MIQEPIFIGNFKKRKQVSLRNSLLPSSSARVSEERLGGGGGWVLHRHNFGSIPRPMSEGEVLEVGADGSFEIPSPTRITIEEDSDDERNPESYSPGPLSIPVIEKSSDEQLSFVEDSTTTFSSLIGDISPGGYKLYQSRGNNCLVVLIRLEKEEKPEKLFVFDKSIEVQSSINRTLCVDLPNPVDTRSGRAQVMGDIVSVSVIKI